MNNKLAPDDIVYSAPENQETSSEKFKSSPYHQNPSFMKEKDEYKYHYEGKKKIVDKQGNKNGITYVWEVTKSITEQHFTPGNKLKASKFECNNQPYPVVSSTDVCPQCHVKHIDLRGKDKVAWRTQFDPMWGNQAKQNVACWKTSHLILTDAGLSASSGTVPDYIGIATEVNNHTALSYNTANLAKAVAYLDSELSLKHPVLIGVNHDLNYHGEGNNDHTTDHFVVVVGTGCDNGKRYYLFYDVGTRQRDKGTSDQNRLYLLKDKILGGTAYDTTKTYTVAQVRRNSSK